MTTEDDGLRIDMRKLFPEAANRAGILERLKRSWPSVIRDRGVWRYSEPVALGVDYLAVETWNDFAEKKLANMKGNIQRGLKRLGYDSWENFTVKINVRERQKNLPSRKPARVKVIESDEKLRQYMSVAPDTLPDDINFALSHLMMYLDGRKVT